MKQIISILIGVLLFLSGLLTAKDYGPKPADVLNLEPWKLTLPYAKGGKESPVEIKQPALDNFENSDYFYVDTTKNGVVFRAHCGGVTTDKSGYPRCELREMAIIKTKKAEKYVNANWSTTDGILHRLKIVQAITAVPLVKKHVVVGQIHDAKDDVIMIRLENKKLQIERNRYERILLDKNYKLGRRFTILIEAYDGFIKVWYNNNLKMDWKYKRNGCYFKAGCYTQSNIENEEKPDSFGEVVIFDLEIEHVVAPFGN